MVLCDLIRRLVCIDICVYVCVCRCVCVCVCVCVFVHPECLRVIGYPYIKILLKLLSVFAWVWHRIDVEIKGQKRLKSIKLGIVELSNTAKVMDDDLLFRTVYTQYLLLYIEDDWFEIDKDIEGEMEKRRGLQKGVREPRIRRIKWRRMNWRKIWLRIMSQRIRMKIIIRRLEDNEPKNKNENTY